MLPLDDLHSVSQASSQAETYHCEKCHTFESEDFAVVEAHEKQCCIHPKRKKKKKLQKAKKQSAKKRKQTPRPVRTTARRSAATSRMAEEAEAAAEEEDEGGGAVQYGDETDEEYWGQAPPPELSLGLEGVVFRAADDGTPPPRGFRRSATGAIDWSAVREAGAGASSATVRAGAPVTPGGLPQLLQAERLGAEVLGVPEGEDCARWLNSGVERYAEDGCLLLEHRQSRGAVVECSSKSFCRHQQWTGDDAGAAESQASAAAGGFARKECNSCTAQSSKRPYAMSAPCFARTLVGRDAKAKRWALLAQAPIKEGALICELAGRATPLLQSGGGGGVERSRRRAEEEQSWEFEMRYGEARYSVDCGAEGNESRFVGRGSLVGGRCGKANAVLQPVLWEQWDSRYPHMLLFAGRRIEEGEPILCDFIAHAAED